LSGWAVDSNNQSTTFFNHLLHKDIFTHSLKDYEGSTLAPIEDEQNGPEIKFKCHD